MVLCIENMHKSVYNSICKEEVKPPRTYNKGEKEKMKNMTKHELTEKIKDLKVELEKEIAENGNSKRSSFLQATINLYIKKLYE